MNWHDWLAPSFVGVALGLVVSLLTGRLTRRHSEKMFHLQRDAQRQDELRTQGRKLAEHVLTQLDVLNENLHYTIYGQHDEHRYELCRAALRELKHATIVLPEPSLRARLVLVHDVLSYIDEISQWGKPVFNGHKVVAIGISEGVEAVGAFIRGDEVPELSSSLRDLHASYDVTLEELAWQHEEQKRSEMEWRAKKKSES